MKQAELQAGIYSALTGDAPLMALVTGVYTDPQQVEAPESDAAFPYVTIGEDVGTAWDTTTDFGSSASVIVDAWSRSHNFTEAKNIGDAIHTALHHQSLTISGADHVMTIVESITVTRDPDGKSKRAMIQIRVLYDGLS